MSTREDQHPVLSMPMYQRNLAKGFSYVMRPVIGLLDATGVMAGLQRRMNRQFAINDSARSAFGDYVPTARDILVCTYTKSGTNWMLQMMHQAVHLGEAEFDHIHSVIPWPDSDPLPSLSLDADVQTPTDKRVIKSHLIRDSVPYSDNARYITVIRDPKDVFVSSYHFVQDVALGAMMPSVKTWLATYLSPDFMFNSWAKHVHSFWSNRHLDNVLVMTFAEMKTDHAASLRKVLDFVALDLTEAQFDKVLHKSTFQYMKNIDDKFYPGPVFPFAPAKGNMMRKGAKGSSGDLLSPEQQHAIDDYFRAELVALGSDFPYDEHFGK